MRIVAGVDGCPRGWVAAVWGPDGVQWRVTPLSFGALLDALADAAVVAADVPIGCAPRDCDGLAREVLGNGRSSVFSIPAREVLEAPDYAAACAVSRMLTGKAISLQTWHIGARVLDATDTVAARPGRRVVEAHPEVSFSHLTGERLPSKRGAAGIDARVAALAPVFGDVAALLAACPRPARADDALDALACAWTARRVLDGEARYLGSGPAIAY